eukprot:CAMPEP_0201571130 /NCGR_PEP_ID=MMETSP0190_2-20130828/13746_1 /ASSEMBLY_ACC=CAM_ASM_000263 /TAXON_ID=37353 /ORGANISM="Rosalina sp." /LENGTH=126 /DNA_ID=CAMNT_0047995449 /DNA_START=153 /DNA_END=533 /DNA_ORIENTATION=-
MKEVVAFMLARLGGNEKPSKEDITSILDSVGIKPDTDKLDALFADIDKLGCSVDEAIKNGMDKLAVIPSGGGGGGGGSGDGDAGGATGGGDDKKEEESESESKSSSKAGGNLFGGGDTSSDEDSSD